jgi:hypothetical protein
MAAPWSEASVADRRLRARLTLWFAAQGMTWFTRIRGPGGRSPEQADVERTLGGREVSRRL